MATSLKQVFLLKYLGTKYERLINRKNLFKELLTRNKKKPQKGFIQPFETLPSDVCASAGKLIFC